MSPLRTFVSTLPLSLFLSHFTFLLLDALLKSLFSWLSRSHTLLVFFLCLQPLRWNLLGGCSSSAQLLHVGSIQGPTIFLSESPHLSGVVSFMAILGDNTYSCFLSLVFLWLPGDTTVEHIPSHLPSVSSGRLGAPWTRSHLCIPRHWCLLGLW